MTSLRALHLAADAARADYDQATNAFLENRLERKTWVEIRSQWEAAERARDAAMHEVTGAWHAYIGGRRDAKHFENWLAAVLAATDTAPTPYERRTATPIERH